MAWREDGVNLLRKLRGVSTGNRGVHVTLSFVNFDMYRLYLTPLFLMELHVT
jgi:hypothetical protein